MKNILALSIAALLVMSSPPAFAQQRTNIVVADCESLSLSPGTASYTYTDRQGRLCTTGGSGGSGGDITSVIPGTGATNLGKAIDTATGGTDTGVLFLGTRANTLSTLTPANGDNVQARFDGTGALWTRDINSVTDASEGAAVATAPVPIGCVYRTSFTTLDVGDVGYPICDVNGRLVLVGLGTAGTAAGGLLSIQGAASMKAVKSSGDPCDNPDNTLVSDTLSFASSTVQKIVTKTSAKKNYICALYVQVGGTAETWSLLEGTNDMAECDTDTVALMGSATASEGNASGANGGVSYGNGRGSVVRGKTANSDMCIATSGSNRTVINYVWTQQ